MSTAYDVVAYNTLPSRDYDPSHIAAVATLYGVPCREVERSRVLEIGCGEATHLVACAVSLPEAQFVGIDLSPEAIARGKELVARCGLTNITLEVGDITTWQNDSAPFDYILTHGVFSWVPPAVRDSLLALIKLNLAPTGVVYISYNVLPGCYSRQMLWDMLKFHTAEIADPLKKIAEAKEFTELLQQTRPHAVGIERDVFDNELRSVLEQRQDGVIYHDDLATVNDPIYFHQFFDHIQQHGLTFVSEAEPIVLSQDGMPRPMAEALEHIAAGDVARREQYYDFASLRRFRESLVTHNTHQPRLKPDTSILRSLYFAGVRTTDPSSVPPDPPLTYTQDSLTVKLNSPLAVAAVHVLGTTGFRRLSFDELKSKALAALQQTDATPDEIEAMFADLVAAWHVGLVLLSRHRPPYATIVPDRPTVSPLARDQLERGSLATNLMNTTIAFDDELSRRMATLMDGTRTVSAVVAKLREELSEAERPSELLFLATIEQYLDVFLKSGFILRA